MEYCIIRSHRKSLAIEISPRGEILVRAPFRMAKRDIQSFITARQDWIASQLSKLPIVTPLTKDEHQALIQSAKEFLPQRVSYYARQMDVTYGRITVRSQQRRWGSCSASGNLSFNCLMMLMPPEVRDYIIVHELCHRKQMNHSACFWAEVEKFFPDYLVSRQWLKDNGTALLAKFPKI